MVCSTPWGIPPFDCSAKFKGESLIKHLLQGPDLTNNLMGVLCRFRKEHVAFMCNVEGMFHEVKVSEECRDLLAFSGGRMVTLPGSQRNIE